MRKTSGHGPVAGDTMRLVQLDLGWGIKRGLLDIVHDADQVRTAFAAKGDRTLSLRRTPTAIYLVRKATRWRPDMVGKRRDQTLVDELDGA